MTTIRIFTGTDLKVSIRMMITNTLPNGIRNRLGRKVGKKAIRLIIILLAIAKKYIYNAYYKREANFSNSKIYFALKQNFRLLKIYRKEKKLYLDHKYDFDQEKDLEHCLEILENFQAMI